jgi:hypothetical protein
MEGTFHKVIFEYSEEKVLGIFYVLTQLILVGFATRKNRKTNEPGKSVRSPSVLGVL